MHLTIKPTLCVCCVVQQLRNREPNLHSQSALCPVPPRAMIREAALKWWASRGKQVGIRLCVFFCISGVTLLALAAAFTLSQVKGC